MLRRRWQRLPRRLRSEFGADCPQYLESRRQEIAVGIISLIVIARQHGITSPMPDDDHPLVPRRNPEDINLGRTTHLHLGQAVVCSFIVFHLP